MDLNSFKYGKMLLYGTIRSLPVTNVLFPVYR